MSTKENRSIAYIYNEMDPSEKLEFERDLQYDSDLLIEVESLKKIAKNLDQLEPMDPPAHVVEAVYQSAKKREKSTKNYWKPIIYSAAALLLIGMTSGIFLLEDPLTKEGESQQTESASISTSGNERFTQPMSRSSFSEKNMQPWVDNNEILYFRGQTASDNSAVSDSIRSESLKKLTPVNPSGVSSRQRQLQLTGSHN